MFILAYLCILCVTFQKISCECQESFKVVCDNLEDILKYRTETWSELLVGNLTSQDNLPLPVALTDEFFQYLPNLYSLTIINRLDNGWLNHWCPRLDYLNLNKNLFSNLPLNIFSKFSDLRTLILTDNRVENLISSLESSSLRVLDLSKNSFKSLASGQLVKTSLKWIIMKNGRLSSISSSAFPSTLQILSLDYNNVEAISDEVLENLNELEQLFVPHNKLQQVPNVTKLNKIRLLDFSNNNIEVLEDYFSHLKNLNYLDLSYNKIRKISNQAQINNDYDFIRISLAFNKLTNLNRDDIQTLFGHSSNTVNNTISLYGNPFLCQCLPEITSSCNALRYTDCDRSYFSSGKTPVCLEGNVNVTKCPKNAPEVDEGDFKTFLKAIEESKASVGCELSRQFYYEWNSIIKRKKLYD